MPAIELFSTPLFSDPSLKAYYRLENTNDSGSNGYNLSTAVGSAPSFAAAQFNNGASYSGANAHTNASLVWSATTSWSCSFWLKDTSGSSAYRRWVMNNAGALAANDFIIREDNNEIQLLINNGAGNVSTSGLSGSWKNSWHHFVVVSNGTTTKVYMDSVEILSTANVSTPFNGIYLGGYYSVDNNEYTTGQLDDVAVFDRELTQMEIYNLFNGLNAIELFSTPLFADANLQAYWRFSSNSNDETANNNDGTDSNMSYASGVFGNGAIFNGSSSKITLNDSTSLAFTTNGSISMWIKLDNVSSNARGEVIGQWVAGNYSFLIYHKANSGKIVFGGTSDAGNSDGAEIEISGTLSAAKLHHLVITKSGVTVTFYLDGSSSGSGSMNASALYNSTAPWIMGQNGNGDGWLDGMLDDVAFFNRVLTSQEVADLYAGSFSTVWEQSCDEVITIADTISQKITGKIINEVVTIVDATVGKAVGRAFIEVTTIVEEFTIGVATLTFIVLEEAVQITDSVIKLLSRFLSEVVVLDGIVSTLTKARGFILGKNNNTNTQIGTRLN